jgi:hypothetical protein
MPAVSENQIKAREIAVHQINGSGSLWSRIVCQNVEWKLHWLLRIGVFMEFVGHGAFGVRTKAGWLPYFHVFGIPDHVAWNIMPVVGTLDIVLGILTLLIPMRGMLLYMAVWGTFTALLRPAADQGWWEFFERSYNYGGPAMLLALHGWGRSARDWLSPLHTVPLLSVQTTTRYLWIFRIIVALMLIGHGGYGAFLAKKNLLGFYQAAGLGGFGLPMETWRAGIGFFEMGLGAAALLTVRPGFYVFVFVWKVLSELLHVRAGAEGAWWEVIERGGCYMVPLVTVCVIYALRQRGQLPGGDDHPVTSRYLVT